MKISRKKSEAKKKNQVVHSSRKQRWKENFVKMRSRYIKRPFGFFAGKSRGHMSIYAETYLIFKRPLLFNAMSPFRSRKNGVKIPLIFSRKKVSFLTIPFSAVRNQNTKRILQQWWYNGCPTFVKRRVVLRWLFFGIETLFEFRLRKMRNKSFFQTTFHFPI